MKVPRNVKLSTGAFKVQLKQILVMRSVASKVSEEKKSANDPQGYVQRDSLKAPWR
jgi:hypothetical protein